jgi:hypothetical protein
MEDGGKRWQNITRLCLLAVGGPVWEEKPDVELDGLFPNHIGTFVSYVVTHALESIDIHNNVQHLRCTVLRILYYA